MVPGRTYTFHLVNLGKPNSLFEEGAQPVMLSRRRFSQAGIGWTREGKDVAYYANGCLLGTGKPAHTLSFSIDFPYEDDDVFLAHFFPYGYSDYRRDAALWWSTAPGLLAPTPVERLEVLRTPGGLAVEAFRIGANVDSRPTAVLIARAHPGESPGSWVMRGACEFLLRSACDDAVSCREQLSWLLVPMLNPDGVVLGNTRTNAAGVDLNRHHHDDSAPETIALRNFIAAIAAEGGVPPLAFVDIHGHSRRRGVFLMGNAGASARLPALLAKQTSLFDFQGSAFYSTHRSGRDAGVGRVSMAARGCPHSFTLEASFGMHRDAEQHLVHRELEQVGRALCLALRNLTEPDEEPPVAMPSVDEPADDEQ
jgi:hypothetical protein